MALLLDKILAEPENFGDVTQRLTDNNPPAGLEAEAWLFKEELPLHIINYLRDATSKILSSSACKRTPSKGKRPVKYDYNSPIKSVTKEKPKKPRPEKKKVKLFPAGQPISEENGSGGDASSLIDGVGELPPTPLRYKQQKPQEPRKRQSPSPQPLSLADFMRPDSSGGRLKSASRSPKKSKSRIKSSTPNPESFVSRLGRLEEENKPKKLDIDSKELFPEMGGGGGIDTRKRRIKPISLASQPSNNQSGFGTITQIVNGGPTCFAVEEVEKDSVDDRSMMKEAANLTPFKGFLGESKTPNKSSSRPAATAAVARPPLISPCPASVTSRPLLDLLASLYSHTILNNLMPNLNVELYFIVELLQVESWEVDKAEETTDSNPLGSLHNCVYFSVRVISLILPYLQFLDRSSLKLMMENPRISLFSDCLCVELAEVCDKTVGSSPPPRLKPPTTLQNISFQTETDNRLNFPSDASFHDFKKQRDKFYALIRCWGEHPRAKDYSFSTVFGAQVDDVLRMYHHPVNYSHFCSLFLQQLLAMCRGEQPRHGSAAAAGSLDLGKDELKASLKGLDPVKYARLAARLVTPGQHGGPCPPPSFIGAQEFFRDFIMHCSSPRFLHHLKDVVIAEIVKGVEIYLGVDEQSLLMKSDASRLSESSLNEETSGLGSTDSDSNHLVQQTVLTLRLSGKFLGLLEFAPYIFSDRQPNGFDPDDPVFLLRKNSSPPLEIKQMLERAELSGRLMLMLPWLVEFMVQMDAMSHHINYYKELSLMLVKIYQKSLRPGSINASPSVAFFLSAYIGWLLEKEEFPRDLIILAMLENHTPPTLEDDALDVSFFVPHSLVYQCCPWLSEIKVLLSTSNQASNGCLPSLEKDNYRKITPISAPKHAHQDKEENIQKELEENFLTNQPSSLRRITEFVAERLASNTIKYIRNCLVPAERTRVFDIIKTKYTVLSDKNLEFFGLDCANRVMAAVRNILSKKGREDTEATLNLLISDDINPAAKDVAVGLTVRNMVEKVEHWSRQKINQTYFINEFLAERDRLVKAEGRERGGERSEVFVSHDPSAPSPSSLLITLKKEILANLNPTKANAKKRRLTNQNASNNGSTSLQNGLDAGVHHNSTDSNINQNGHKASEELENGAADGLEASEEQDIGVADEQMKLVEGIEQCLRHRRDLTHVAAQALGAVSVDWIVSLIACNPQIVNKTLINQLISVLKLTSPVQLLSIISPSSLMILEHSKNKQLTWSTMRLLLGCLLRENLVPALALEDACIQLAQQNWGGDSLSMLGACLTGLVEEGGWEGALDWVAWFNQDMS